ncbi:MAG: flagellar biosynthesis protein FliQ [Rhodospirillales bacterium]|nr:flagellar biosynthesis protein FliQ [Rhodospirillales bacterium]
MSEAAVLEIGRNGIWIVLQLSAPIMAAGLLIGLVIALFQALTTIQEMTLTFVPKIVVIFVSLLVFLPFMMTTLIEFSQELFGLIVILG